MTSGIASACLPTWTIKFRWMFIVDDCHMQMTAAVQEVDPEYLSWRSSLPTFRIILTFHLASIWLWILHSWQLRHPVEERNKESLHSEYAAILQLASALRSKSWKLTASVAVDGHFTCRCPYHRRLVHLPERKKKPLHSYIKWCLCPFVGSEH